MGKRKFDSSSEVPETPVESQPPLKKNFEKNTNTKLRPFTKKRIELEEKPEDWNKLKQERKELKIKRKSSKDGFDIIVQAKKIGEKLRRKTLKEGETERVKLINQLHGLLKDKGQYSKFVLAHDTSRIIQWLLKYSSDIVKEQISKELVPVALDMLQSKYGIFCVKRLLKYGSTKTKTEIVTKFYGNAVKLSTHNLSAPVFEYAYSNCATPLQKSHLMQEFYGDMYKKSKDDQVKHLKHVFEQSPDLKTAILGATKANLLKVINKNLLDSSLVQSVAHQFLTSCSDNDRIELIQLLIPQIVVIGNSKDGVRAAMQCIWHGGNKDRKLAMKTIKEHVIELCKHEHGHCTIITLLDTADDTVLVQKIILNEILKNARELAKNEWGRRVIMWLVAPGDSKCFHPKLVEELEAGRRGSNAKKDPDLRRTEILTFAQGALFRLIVEEPKFWLESSSIAFLALAIVKSWKGGADDGLLREVLQGMAKVVVDPDWTVKLNGKEERIGGIEEAGIHLVLKKLLLNDRQLDDGTFGEFLLGELNEELLEKWIQLNRACFVLVAIYECNNETVQNELKEKLSGLLKKLGKQNTAGSRILLEKIK